MSTFTEKDIKEWSHSNYYQPRNKSSSASKVSAPPFRKVNDLPPLYSYPLEVLRSHLDRNEKMLKDTALLNKLPDKGKKLLDSNKMIKEAIYIKSKMLEEPPRQLPNKITKVYNHSQTNSLSEVEIAALRARLLKKKEINKSNRDINNIDKQLSNLSLSNASLSTSGNSDSSRESLSSVSTSSPSMEKLQIKDFDKSKPRLANNYIPFNKHKDSKPPKINIISNEESRKFLDEEERRRQENVLLHSIKMQKSQVMKPVKAPHQYQRLPLFSGFDDDDSDDFDGFSEDEYC